MSIEVNKKKCPVCIGICTNWTMGLSKRIERKRKKSIF
jgi:hypothetical protein